MVFAEAIVPPHHQSSGVNSRSRVNWYGMLPRRHSDHRTSATTNGTSMPTTVTGASRSAAARAAFGSRYPKRQMPGFAAGRSSFSHSATAEEEGLAAGAWAGRGGSFGGPAGRGTGFACVPRASCVPSLSIAPAP